MSSEQQTSTAMAGSGAGGKVYMNGTVFDPADAKISIFDRGFLYGDSVYETMRVYDGVPFAFDEHLERLHASGQRVGFVLPWTSARLRDAVFETLRASGFTDAYCRMIGTRGSGPVGLDPNLAENAQLIVMVLPLPKLPDSFYNEGRSMAVVSVKRNSKRALDPQAKTGNYMNSVLAAREARAQGADDAIMLDHDGRVAEASAANVFAFIDGVWCTPPLDVGILSGITRKTLLRVCAEQGVAAEERVLWPADLQRASEMFTCSSVREIVPIVKLDGAPVGDGKVGQATQQARTMYQAEVARQIAAAQSRG